MGKFIVRVPATTANLGPGFDSLGLALNLWNEAIFEETGAVIRIEIHGEGEDTIPQDAGNLIARAALRVFAAGGHIPPPGLHVRCTNRIPLGSGLGSSAAATLAGLLGANAMLPTPLSQAEILSMATEMEGHPDNVAPGLHGSLAISTTLIPAPTENRAPIITRRIPVGEINAAVVVPSIDLPTRASRAALPLQVAIRDAVFNIGRVALVVEAFRSGDLELLGQVMEDRLHQPYRLKLIPGAESALQAAREAGAAAVALSGAGPGVVAFCRQNTDAIVDVMISAFQRAGVTARGWALQVSPKGASCTPLAD